MRPGTTTRRPLAHAIALLVAATGCTSGSVGSAPDEPDRTSADVLVDIPGVEPVPLDAQIALIGADGRLGVVEEGRVRHDWSKFRALPSPDGSMAVLTLPHEVAASWGPTLVQWVSLPDGVARGEIAGPGGLELAAVSLDGEFAGLTTVAAAPIDGTIAGGRAISEIVIASRAGGVVFATSLDGNFAPEAFSRRTTADGVPAQVFLLEYFPAEAPRFYRVRVLSTETGEVSLPVNLRDKSQQVDERMAGFTRSQVVAHDQGLLFTLYRGTIDGTPDGEPYAFVHTLDFADGVWCLEVDPRLELETLPGTLAVSGDRLFVASANGRVGAFAIPSITDPTRSPTMDWVADVVGSTVAAPLLVGDGDGGVLVADRSGGRLVGVDATGRLAGEVRLPGPDVTALAWSGADLHAIGPDWATFGEIERPAWLGEVARLVVAG